MEENYWQYIEEFLSKSSVMLPSPTLMEAQYNKDHSIKAAVFDVYGTILISASGDIDESEISAENLKIALAAAGITLNGKASHTPILTDILNSFKNAIYHTHSLERSENKPFPEVNILSIWKKILTDFHNRKYLMLKGQSCIRCFTFIFEVLSNRIYPMPGMKEVINKLAQHGFPLGIISNAQFYTPVILNFFMHDKALDLEEVLPFDKDITVFSYKYMRSKPDNYLFDIVKRNCLNKYKIEAHEILFIGNDMYRDVYPAKSAGFKTALFAGDAKSLRLRKEKPEVNKLSADYVITDLHQLLQILI